MLVFTPPYILSYITNSTLRDSQGKVLICSEQSISSQLLWRTDLMLLPRWALRILVKARKHVPHQFHDFVVFEKYFFQLAYTLVC